MLKSILLTSLILAALLSSLNCRKDEQYPKTWQVVFYSKNATKIYRILYGDRQPAGFATLKKKEQYLTFEDVVKDEKNDYIIYYQDTIQNITIKSLKDTLITLPK